MVESHACGIELFHTLARLWQFVKSDEGEMLFLIAATVRAIFYYLLRNPLREARELAYTIAAFGIFAAWVAISDTRQQAWVRDTFSQCVAGILRAGK